MLKKKALISFVLSAALMVVAGCGQKANPTPAAGGTASPTPAATAAAQKTYKVSISQIVEHPSLDATRQGFLAALKDAGIVEGTNLRLTSTMRKGIQQTTFLLLRKLLPLTMTWYSVSQRHLR